MVFLAALIAVCVSIASLYHVGGHGLSCRCERTDATGTAEILVDSQTSALAALSGPNTSTALAGRAPLYAGYATNPAVVADIARYARMPESRISVQSNITQGALAGGTPASTTLTAGSGSNLVVLSASDAEPTINIAAQGPTTALASRLAGATVRALQTAVVSLQVQQNVRRGNRIVLRQIGGIATTPVAVTSPSVSTGIVLGLAAFLVLGGAAAFAPTRPRGGAAPDGPPGGGRQRSEPA